MARGQEDFAHIGPSTLAGRFLRHFWQPIFVASDLIKGRPVRVEALGEFFTLYRGESGQVHLVQDRCPHRQTSLSLGWVVGEDIRCFYHGWTFAGDGRCTHMPAEKKSFAEKVRCTAYRVEEYLGLIFAYLGEGEAPPLPRFPEVERQDGIRLVSAHPVPCNYFQRIENDLDELHVHFVHNVSTDQYGLDEFPEIRVTETQYGIFREGIRKGGGANATRTAHWMMPNIHFVDLPPSPDNQDWTIHLAWRVPVNDVSMTTFSISLRRGDPNDPNLRETKRAPLVPDPTFLSEEILAGRMRIQDIDPTYRGLFVVQDNVALAGQGRIVDRSLDRLGQSDRGITLLSKLWDRELKALKAGKPIKNWHRPTERLSLLVNAPTDMADMPSST